MLRFLFKSAILFFFLFYPTLSTGGDPSEGKNLLAHKIEGLIERASAKCRMDEEKIGIAFHSFEQNQSLFSKNRDTLLIPASNMKLITTAAALKILKPDYRFETLLFAENAVSKGRIEGPLYIQGRGDPKLVSEEMWLILEELKTLGIEEITGDILIDDTFFDEARYGNGWEESINSRAYSAKTGALSLNFNTIAVDIAPGKEAGAPPRVSLFPPTDTLEIVNKAITRKGGQTSLSIHPLRKGGKGKILLRGYISIHKKKKRYYRSIASPPLFAGEIFKEMAQREGIAIGGRVRRASVPEGAHGILVHKSQPLSLVVRDLNKLSNNFMAEQIIKTLGAASAGAPGSWEKGIAAVEDFMEKEVAISRESYTMVDGSGFSRKNRVSVGQLLALLKSMHKDFTLSSEYIGSLPVMGVDGSLQDRYIGKNVNRLVRAKTGNLSGVSSLSGYGQKEGGENFAFSIIVNGFNCSIDKVWEFQQKVVETVLKSP